MHLGTNTIHIIDEPSLLEGLVKSNAAVMDALPRLRMSRRAFDELDLSVPNADEAYMNLVHEISRLKQSRRPYERIFHRYWPRENLDGDAAVFLAGLLHRFGEEAGEYRLNLSTFEDLARLEHLMHTMDEVLEQHDISYGFRLQGINPYFARISPGKSPLPVRHLQGTYDEIYQEIAGDISEFLALTDHLAKLQGVQGRLDECRYVWGEIEERYESVIDALRPSLINARTVGMPELGICPEETGILHAAYHQPFNGRSGYNVRVHTPSDKLCMANKALRGTHYMPHRDVKVFKV